LNKKNFPRIIAHRGLRNHYPENTVEAINAALALDGVWGVEFDVELSDQPVVVHQETMVPDLPSGKLERAGRDYTDRDWVSEMIAQKITRLDAGSWFAPEFSHCKVPLLSDVLSLNWTSKVCHVELKDPTYWSVRNPVWPERIAAAVQPHLKKFTGQLRIIAFNPEIIKEARRLFPNVTLVLGVWMEWVSRSQEATDMARDIDASAIFLPDTMLAKDFKWIDDARKNDLEIYTYPVSPAFDEPEYSNWTAESRVEMWEKILSLGVDGIVSDFCLELLKYINREVN